MSTYLTVDLAPKQSAWMVRDSDGTMRNQGNSLGKSSRFTIDQIVDLDYFFRPDIILIEDVPYGINKQFMVKPVLRLQGMVMEAIYEERPLDDEREIWFINPDSWQKHFPGVGRGGGTLPEREEAARVHAKRLGYEPPNLVQQYIDELPEGKKPLKKHTGPLHKTMTDHIDAFLMQEFINKHDGKIAGLSGVQPFTI